MASARRLPLVGVVLIALVATGVATSMSHARNPSVLPSGLTVSINAESTALYCTGLSSAAGRPGRVTFFNTASSSRSLSVSIVSDQGATWNGSLELAGHATQSIEPSVLDKATTTLKHPKPSTYGVAVQISGGGVVAEEIAGTLRAVVPCSAAGVADWYGAGFDTLVGSSAYLSVYNPTDTSAVLNAAIYSATGISTPQAFQGFSVPAHTQSEIDLGSEVVNTSNVGVHVNVLRGSLEIVGVQDSQGAVSYVQGLSDPSKDAWFPNVTTVRAASAEVRVANPNDRSASVTIDVDLGAYHVAPQSVEVAPFSTGLITITPNSAIPAAGYASLTLHSSEPVVTSLATGTSDWLALTTPEPPTDAVLVSDLTDAGFGAATVTNTSSRTTTLSVATLNPTTPHVISGVGGIVLKGGSTSSLFTLISTLSSAPADTYLLTSSSASLVVSLTLPGAPLGVNVVAPLDGR